MTDQKKTSIRARDKNAILHSLRAGVTPQSGIRHIQVGRVRELESVVENIGNVSKGSAAFRLIVGDFGSGKSFFLKLVKAIVLEKGLISISADLSPDRRLYSTKGQARSLYAELMHNMATRTKPDGNAITSVVERFIEETRKKAKKNDQSMNQAIRSELADFSDLVAGYDFATVIAKYWEGYKEEDEQLKNNAVRWLRGEFTTKLDARAALGVRNIIDDSNYYDYLKLMALFVKRAGYKGLIVSLDEMVNLYKIVNRQSRENNYEQLLKILNDSLQGGASYLGFFFGGTPEFLEDKKRGLYSYEALQSRLAGNRFATDTGLTDYNAIALRLKNLSPEELYLLLKNIRHVQANGDPQKYIVPDEAVVAYLEHCNQAIGSAYFLTPRNTIRGFVDLISILDQHPESSWEQLVGSSKVELEQNTDMPEIGQPGPDVDSDEDDLSSFKL